MLDAFQQTRNIVLSAPPGAGKTTQVPIALLSSDWLADKKIIMLEPRRLAARRAAEFMSAQLGEKTGQTVGYRIRGESVVGKEHTHRSRDRRNPYTADSAGAGFTEHRTDYFR